VVCKFCATPNAIEGTLCLNCEWVNPSGAEHCAHCSFGLSRLCPECRAMNWSGAETCVNCGHPLDALGYMISARQGLTPERLARHRDTVAALKAEEESGSQRRLAYFEEIEKRRQQALAEAKRRAAQEYRRLVIVFTGLIALGVLIAGGLLLFSLLR
jgi:hypothetical protein